MWAKLLEHVGQDASKIASKIAFKIAFTGRNIPYKPQALTPKPQPSPKVGQEVEFWSPKFYFSGYVCPLKLQPSQKVGQEVEF